MAIQRLNPDGLHGTPGYHHVTIVVGFRHQRVELDLTAALH